MLKTETRTIRGMDVAVTQFAGRRNLSVLLDLSKVAGPTIAAATSGGGLDAEIDVGRVGQALFESLDTDRTMKLVTDLLSATAIDGKPVTDQRFNELFAGPALWSLPPVLAFVVEVNFGNFSELVASASEVAAKPVAGQAPES